jgi:hypothetical protein
LEGLKNAASQANASAGYTCDEQMASSSGQ